jgi:hypothetical protein
MSGANFSFSVQIQYLTSTVIVCSKWEKITLTLSQNWSPTFYTFDHLPKMTFSGICYELDGTGIAIVAFQHVQVTPFWSAAQPVAGTSAATTLYFLPCNNQGLCFWGEWSLPSTILHSPKLDRELFITHLSTDMTGLHWTASHINHIRRVIFSQIIHLSLISSRELPARQTFASGMSGQQT